LKKDSKGSFKKKGSWTGSHLCVTFLFLSQKNWSPLLQKNFEEEPQVQNWVFILTFQLYSSGPPKKGFLVN